MPLTLGYEFDFKYLSLELNGGVEYGHLINSSGVEVKSGSVVNDPVPVYFYSDKYIGMMSTTHVHTTKANDIQHDIQVAIKLHVVRNSVST